MSGHSKWSTIKRQKGVTDLKRGQAFTKLSNAITLAVKEGGGVGDPEFNFKLRLAVESAKNMNMPKENIERAIARAKGGLSADVSELTYEGFGLGGFSVIVSTVTDNKQRTVSEVKNVFEKNGGSLGSPGSVSYLFNHKGLITVDPGSAMFDDLFLIAVDSGADDLEEAGESVLIYTKPEDLGSVREKLLEKNIIVKSAELVYKPSTFHIISDLDKAQKAIAFIDKLESLSDVQKVYSNLDFPDDLLKKLE